MLARLPSHGWQAVRLRIDGRFPEPDTATMQRLAAVLAALPDEAWLMVDGLAYGGAVHAFVGAARRLRLLPLIHLPLPDEGGLDAATRQRLQAAEAAALRLSRGVLVTSGWSARRLAMLDYAPPRVGIAPPGSGPAPVTAVRSAPPWRWLCVASLTPRKAQHLLVEALAQLREFDWTCRLVGADDGDYAVALRARIDALGLAARIPIAGPLWPAQVADEYANADAFVLPSTMETYGMVLAEALARGLGIVASRAGAIAETLPADAALLVPPGDAGALACALRRWMTEPELREQLRRGALAAREQLEDWDRAAARFARELDRLTTTAMEKRFHGC
jgi:glycosyltransferase involved in cell wall biosynthesis